MAESLQTPKFYVTASSWNSQAEEDWISADVYVSRDAGASFQPEGSLANQALQGWADNRLPACPGYVWGSVDRFSKLKVRTDSTSIFETFTLSEILTNGWNQIGVGSEIIAFQTVTALGNGNYNLTNLVRGLYDTYDKMATHIAGEPVYQLAPGLVVPVEFDVGELGNEFHIKVLQAGESLTDVTATKLTPTARNLVPHPVANVKAWRAVAATDSIHISWNYVSSIPGQRILSKAVTDVDSGNYTVKIRNAGDTATLRTLTATAATTLTYARADEITDFGSAQTSLNLEINASNSVKTGTAWKGNVTIQKTEKS